MLILIKQLFSFVFVFVYTLVTCSKQVDGEGGVDCEGGWRGRVDRVGW